MRGKRLAALALALAAGLVVSATATPAASVTTNFGKQPGRHGDTHKGKDKHKGKDRHKAKGFVTRKGGDFMLDGKPFRFAGTNNYYLMYKSKLMVDDVFARATAAGFTVVRTWGSLDIGHQDDTNSIHHKEDGVYFQYWDGSKPAYNDGADGLEHLDYVLWRARRSGIKLVIPFINNWSAYGGIDQYVRWANGQYHDDFYTNPTIKGWYKNWISHLLNRVNTLTGVAYKDDPTVMAWELGNEPRCKGSGAYPTSSNCSTATLLSWADEMSRHVKSIDRKHLLSVGDEGFYCLPGGADFTEDCSEGVDTVAFAKLPKIDMMSMHLYPDHWNKDAAWGTQWIKRHLASARKVGKPIMLGEFGLQDKSIRNPVFREWLDTFVKGGGNGFTYWMIAGLQDNGTYYPDYDGFTVYCPSPVCQTIMNAGAMMRHGHHHFAPVADHDTVTVSYGEAATVTATANDIAYDARIQPHTLDLDPQAKGRQSTVTTTAGTFTAGPSGTVTFTPADGFSGRTTISYTVRDSRNRQSNTAEITVIVRPNPGDPIMLFSFEDGVQGWASASWQSDAGTVARDTRYATDGTHSLRVDATGGGWFGTSFAEPVDLSNKAALKMDLRTGAAGTSTSIALQVGPEYTWCQSAFGYQDAETAATVEADLVTGMSCTPEDLRDVRAIYTWISGGTFYIDNIRAE